MKKIICFVLFAISATMAMAQVNPISGFVITNKGDTIRGNIDFRSNERLSKQCDFYANGESTGKTYKPGEIEGFRFDNNGKYFVSRRLNVTGAPELYFAEFMVQGKMNLYCVIDKGDEYFFFEREDGEMAHLTKRNLNYASSNAAEKLKESQQEKQEQYGKVKHLLLKSWKAVEDMDANNMSKTKLVKTVRDYHNDVCTDGSTCMVYAYDEKSEKVKVHFKAIAGYAYYSKDEPTRWDRNRTRLTDYPGSTYEIGIGLEIDLPRYMKGLSAEAGLYITPKKKTTKNINENIVNEYEEILFTNKVYEYEKSIYTLSLGGIKQFGNGKIMPLVRCGGFLSFHTSQEETSIYYNKYNNTKDVDVCDIHDDDKLIGIYLGAGIQIPVGKHYARLHGDWYSSIVKANTANMAKWGITAEFIL